jgi:hypothetical protein
MRKQTRGENTYKMGSRIARSTMVMIKCTHHHLAQCLLNFYFLVSFRSGGTFSST